MAIWLVSQIDCFHSQRITCKQTNELISKRNHVLKYNFVTSRPIEIKNCFLRASIGGSVVECSPATRAARVRFPADAKFSSFWPFFSFKTFEFQEKMTLEPVAN